MKDPFETSLDEPEVPDGPFRTAAPTSDKRLERAREASWARVESATREAMAHEARTARRWNRVAWGLLGVSITTLAALIAAMLLTTAQLGALICPAVSFVIMSALGVVYRVRISRRRDAAG